MRLCHTVSFPWQNSNLEMEKNSTNNGNLSPESPLAGTFPRGRAPKFLPLGSFLGAPLLSSLLVCGYGEKKMQGVKNHPSSNVLCLSSSWRMCSHSQNDSRAWSWFLTETSPAGPGGGNWKGENKNQEQKGLEMEMESLFKPR